MTGKQQIDYEALTQDALRNIVRTVLLRVAASGLPGDHHFFIAFDTRAPGVVVSKRIKAKYPEEMTVVLQHQFSRLAVNDERFEVTLSFDNVPERLTVPLKAIRRFFDPSVRFIIHFEGSDLMGNESSGPEPEGTDLPEVGPRPRAPRSADQDEATEAAEPDGPSRFEKVRGARKPAALQNNDAPDQSATRSPDEASGPTGGQSSRRQTARPKLVKSKTEAPANDAKVVELDKFRKK